MFVAALTTIIFVNTNCIFASGLDGEAKSDIQAQEEAFAGTGGAGFDLTLSIGDIMAAVIKGFIALLGVIFVVLIILAGYKWMNAGGEEERVREAKDTIQRAIIGLIIIIAAYAITEFVFTHLPWGTGPQGGPVT